MRFGMCVALRDASEEWEVVRLLPRACRIAGEMLDPLPQSDATSYHSAKDEPAEKVGAAIIVKASRRPWKALADDTRNRRSDPEVNPISRPM